MNHKNSPSSSTTLSYVAIEPRTCDAATYQESSSARKALTESHSNDINKSRPSSPMLSLSEDDLPPMVGLSIREEETVGGNPTCIESHFQVDHPLDLSPTSSPRRDTPTSNYRNKTATIERATSADNFVTPRGTRRKNRLRQHNSYTIPRPSKSESNRGATRNESDSTTRSVSPISSFLSELRRKASASSMEIVADDSVSHRSVVAGGYHSSPQQGRKLMTGMSSYTGGMTMEEKKMLRWEQDSSLSRYNHNHLFDLCLSPRYKGEDGELKMTPPLIAADSPVMCPKRRKSVEDSLDDHHGTDTTIQDPAKDVEVDITTLKLEIERVKHELLRLYPDHNFEDDIELDDEDIRYNAKEVADRMIIPSSMKEQQHLHQSPKERQTCTTQLPPVPNLLSSSRPTKSSSSVASHHHHHHHNRHRDCSLPMIPLGKSTAQVPRCSMTVCSPQEQMPPSTSLTSSSSSSTLPRSVTPPSNDDGCCDIVSTLLSSSSLQLSSPTTAPVGLPNYRDALQAVQERYACTS